MKWVLALMAAGAAWGQISFVNEGVVDAPPSEVWKIWSTPEGFRVLGLPKSEFDFRVGGLIRSRYGNDGVLGDEETIHNRILAFEPERMMATVIERAPKSFPFKEAWKKVWTVMTLTAVEGGRTHVRVTSLGFGDDEESRKMREHFEKGNQWEIEVVQKHFQARGPSFVNEIELDATPAEVWAVWSTPEGYKLTGVDMAEVDWRVGGLIRTRYGKGVLGDEETIHTRLLAFEPERMLATALERVPKSFAFQQAFQGTWSVTTLTALDGGRTRVHIATMGYRDDEESRQLKEFFEQGNQSKLEDLQKYFKERKR